jgi:hypothetical protein
MTAFLSWGTLLLLSGNVAAMTFRVQDSSGKRILIAEGPINGGDESLFERVLNQQRGSIDEVWFNSPGGSTSAGYGIGRRIRAAGLAVRIPKGWTCASACADAFLGGVVRYIDADRAFGIHMGTWSRNEAYLNRAEAEVRTRGTAGAGAIIRNAEQMSAMEIATWTRYVMQMGASIRFVETATRTSVDSMLWLTRREAINLNIINVED